MEWTEITEEQWNEAVDKSIAHCMDGRYRTKETYQGFTNMDDACALCRLFRGGGNDLKDYCPIHEPCEGERSCSCCPEWRDGNKAMMAGNFPDFQNAYVRLVGRLREVRGLGYSDWRAKCALRKFGDIVRDIEKTTQPHVWHDGDYAKWDGTDGFGHDYSERLDKSDNGIVRLKIAGAYDWRLSHPRTGICVTYANSPALSPAPADYKPPERRESGSYGRRGRSDRRKADNRKSDRRKPSGVALGRRVVLN